MDVVGLRDRQGLRRLEVRSRGEVDVVAVVVEFEGSGTAAGGGGSYEDGVQLQDAGEAVRRSLLESHKSGERESCYIRYEHE